MGGECPVPSWDICRWGLSRDGGCGKAFLRGNVTNWKDSKPDRSLKLIAEVCFHINARKWKPVFRTGSDCPDPNLTPPGELQDLAKILKSLFCFVLKKKISSYAADSFDRQASDEHYHVEVFHTQSVRMWPWTFPCLCSEQKEVWRMNRTVLCRPVLCQLQLEILCFFCFSLFIDALVLKVTTLCCCWLNELMFVIHLE